MVILHLLGLVFDLAGCIDHFCGKKTGRWFMRWVSESWPTAQATVLSGHIKESQHFCTLFAPYSFHAGGSLYGGRYERAFRSEAEGQKMLDRLLGSRPLVRYRADCPDESILMDN